MNRLFVAIAIAPAVGAEVARAVAQVRGLAPRARWASGEAAHLTLAFHGAVADDLVPAVADAVRWAAARHRPFMLEVRGAAVFGSPRRPRVLWMGVGGEVAALAAVQSDVAASLERVGLAPEDRAFHPHLTLARARDQRGDPGLAACARALADARLGAQPVTAIVLYESRLGHDGARHHALARGELAG
jgi:RNA 2',3'-cyclic 3'-phosphodiesterase